MAIQQKITPFLWFDDQAEEAARFYVSIFEDSKILSITRYADSGPGPKGSVMLVKFQLEGQEFLALNGGPAHAFTEAISLVVSCESQAEVDAMWSKLSAGGKEVACGWLEDRYGLSWQVVPTAFMRMVADEDPAKSTRVMQAMMQMTKFDIARLEQAYRG